jgi:hypothetical protein
VARPGRGLDPHFEYTIVGQMVDDICKRDEEEDDAMPMDLVRQSMMVNPQMNQTLRPRVLRSPSNPQLCLVD